jgi:uncharacterized protein YdgA (DUF945 family)
MKKSHAFALVFGVLAAAYGGATWWAGQQAQANYQQQLALLQQHYPGLKVLEHRYERGFWHADAYTTLQLGHAPAASVPANAQEEPVPQDPASSEQSAAPASDRDPQSDAAIAPDADDAELTPAEPEEDEAPSETAGPLWLTVQLHDRITHGPILGLSSLGAARLASTVRLDPRSSPAMVQALRDQILLTAETRLGLTGDLSSQLQGPALNWATEEGERWTWQGFSGHLNQAAASPHVSYELSAAGLQIDNPSDGSHLGFDGLSLRGIDKSINALWALSGRDEGQVAHIRLQFDETADDDQPFKLQLDQVQFQQNNKQTGDLLDSQIHVTGSGQAGELAINRFEMQTSFTRLHTPSYLQMASQLATLDADDLDSQSQVIRNGLAAMLAYDPVYALDKLALDIDGQHGELSYQLSMPGVTPEEKDVPLSLLAISRLQLQAQASLPVAWMEWMARETALDEGGELTPAGAQALLEELVQQGLVVRDGAERIKSTLRYQHGQLEVNGQPLRNTLGLLNSL